MNGGDDELDLAREFDDDPTAGGSDIGGRAGEPYEDDDGRGDDEHEPGGGHTGIGKGPTGS